MTQAHQPWMGANVPQVPGHAGMVHDSRRMRHHAGEGIEDGLNVPGMVLCALAVIALALTLTAAGYGFAGWATIAAITSVTLFLLGTAWLYVEWRREHRRHIDPTARQGH